MATTAITTRQTSKFGRLRQVRRTTEVKAELCLTVSPLARSQRKNVARPGTRPPTDRIQTRTERPPATTFTCRTEWATRSSPFLQSRRRGLYRPTSGIFGPFHFAFASPGAGFRITPCTCVSATARAFGSLLDTTAFSTSRTDRHSIAVAAPVRRVLRRRFPFAHTPGLVVPDRLRGLWFSHLPQLTAVAACLRLGAQSVSPIRNRGPGRVHATADAY